ncbi:transcription elongation factor [Actinoplanes sp. NPDC048796]|uniref:MOSC domain-containing protein n=1 Tax=Actinoplanes sp. NPDC048796 TaxID=3155640 RepID=UPI0033E7E770
MSLLRGTVASVSRNDVYSFTKPARDEIVLVAGLGVEGDVHAGVNVRHRHRVKLDPTQPNLRQVHLIHEELFGEVGEKGYSVNPGNLGENVTTSGVDLLGLPLGTILRFGPPRPAAVSDAASSGSAGPDAASLGAAGPDAASLGAAGPDAASLGAAGADAASLGAAGADAASLGAAGADAASLGAAEAGVAGLGAAGAGVAGLGAARAGAAGANGAGGVDGSAALAGVLEAAGAATLDEATAVAAAGVAAAAERSDAAARENGEDPRPAVILAGLRNPCQQINRFQRGLLKEVIGQDEQGNVVRKGGVMAVVLRGGPVRAGDAISVELPPAPLVPLECV